MKCLNAAFLISVTAFVIYFMPRPAASEGLGPLAAIKEPPHQYEFMARYFFDHYSYYDRNTNGIAASLIYRDMKSVTLFAELINQDKFRSNETQTNLGGAYKISDATTIQEIIGFSSGNGTFPEVYSDTELIQGIYENTYLHLGYMFSRFEDVRAHVFSLGATVYPSEKYYLHTTWFHAITDFSGSSSNGTSDSFLLKAGVYPGANSEAAVFYGKNSDSFLSRDEVGETDSNTYGLMLKAYFSKNWGVFSSVSYEDRDKPSGGYQTRVDIGIMYRQ